MLVNGELLLFLGEWWIWQFIVGEWRIVNWTWLISWWLVN